MKTTTAEKTAKENSIFKSKHIYYIFELQFRKYLFSYTKIRNIDQFEKSIKQKITYKWKDDMWNVRKFEKGFFFCKLSKYCIISD